MRKENRVPVLAAFALCVGCQAPPPPCGPAAPHGDAWACTVAVECGAEGRFNVACNSGDGGVNVCTCTVSRADPPPPEPVTVVAPGFCTGALAGGVEILDQTCGWRIADNQAGPDP